MLTLFVMLILAGAVWGLDSALEARGVDRRLRAADVYWRKRCERERRTF